MSKQKIKQETSSSKKAAPKDAPVVGYIFRNLLIIVVIGFLFFLFDRMNEKQSRMPELYQEFQQLRQTGSNPQRLEELYNEIMEIQNDTSYLKKLTRGYRWAIHDMAIGNMKNIQEIKEKMKTGQIKSLTHEEKLAQRVGNYSLLQYVNNNTPKDAVILLPHMDSIGHDSKWNFIGEPEWTEYFIYPRLCISPRDEQRFPDLAKRISHVLIINGIGYDRLKYEVPVDKRVSETVLPIDFPPGQNPNP